VGMMQAITEWTRRATSSFGGSRPGIVNTTFPETVLSAAEITGDLVYRLKRWPVLPTRLRTAEVLRVLSVMSSRPVRRSWILERTRLDERHLDLLTGRLARQGALDILDPARLPTERRAF
jgi:hypothetical protein